MGSPLARPTTDTRTTAIVEAATGHRATNVVIIAAPCAEDSGQAGETENGQPHARPGLHLRNGVDQEQALTRVLAAPKPAVTVVQYY